MSDEDLYRELNNAAYTKFAAGEYTAAIELYNASTKVCPNAQAWRGIGECHSALGQHREAIFYFAASAGLRPLPKASFQLAQALLHCGFLDEAKRAAQRAIDSMPHFNAARDLLAVINERIGESDATA